MFHFVRSKRARATRVMLKIQKYVDSAEAASQSDGTAPPVLGSRVLATYLVFSYWFQRGAVGRDAERSESASTLQASPLSSAESLVHHESADFACKETIQQVWHEPAQGMQHHCHCCSAWRPSDNCTLNAISRLHSKEE